MMAAIVAPNGDERRPLLSSPTPSNHQSSNVTTPKQTFARPVILCVLALKFFSMFSCYHLLAPRLRLLELSICREYFSTHDPSRICYSPSWPGFHIPERDCKVPEIQKQLSDLRAWGYFFDALITLFLSIPYGYFADRFGRKKGFVLCISGFVMSIVWILVVCTYYNTFSTRAVLWSSAFLAIGGGTNFIMAIVITMIVDVTDLEERSTVMYWALSAYYLGHVSGIGLSSVTMRILWLPYFLSFLSFCFGVAVTIFMPSTEIYKSTLKRSVENIRTTDDLSTSNKSVNVSAILRLRILPILHYLLAHKPLVILVALFPIMAARGAMIELVLPYVSKRYEWPISRVALLDALSGSIGLILGLFVLPAVDAFLRHRHYSPIQANSFVARYSAGALSLSALIIGLAPTIGVMIAGWAAYSTGFGMRMSVLAMVTSLVSPEWAGRVNAIVLTSETLTDLSIGPLIWKSWSFALGMGGKYLGLPFFIVSGALLVVLVALMGIEFGSKVTMPAIAEDTQGLS